jgi:DNA polymerase-3 subunit alpha
MRRYLMEMKPRELANVIAMVALYRPGPMEFIPTYIRRMHGLEQSSYRHPTLAAIFEETYGIPVYQEQIMFAAMEMAGYSASEADGLRKAISKKNARALARHREKFIQGSVDNQIDKHTAVAVFDDWENFARYGFNKAHAADYGVIAVQTAYLKTHYPLEYMTALLSVFKHDSDKVAIYIADCRRMGFDVLPPGVNSSDFDFSAEKTPEGEPAIRYGLGAVKNVGHGAIETILEARQESGPFESLEDFARRVDLRAVGKRALESLVRVGALDALGSRIAMLDALDRISALSAAHFRASEVGQMTFFGEETGVEDSLQIGAINANVPKRRLLRWEKELLGVYVSDHPLTPHLDTLARVITHFSAELAEAEHEQKVCVAGEVSHIRPYRTRSGREMGFVTLEDLQGSIELVIFNRVWKDVVNWLEVDTIVVAQGKVDSERGEPKILVDRITTDIESVEPLEGVVRVNGPKGVSGPARTVTPEENRPDHRGEVLHTEVSLSTDIELPPADVLPAVLEVEAEPSDQPEQTSGPSSGNGQASESRVEIKREVQNDGETRMITIMLESTGNRQRDSLRLRRVHGLLTSFPGNDHFAFLLYEASRRYHLEFPNFTTGYCPELHGLLVDLLGEDVVRVEPLRIQ